MNYWLLQESALGLSNLFPQGGTLILVLTGMLISLYLTLLDSWKQARCVADKIMKAMIVAMVAVNCFMAALLLRKRCCVFK